MNQCLQYLAMCDEDPQYFHAEDCEHAITEGLSQLKKGRAREVVAIKDGLFGFIGRKTQKQAVS